MDEDVRDVAVGIVRDQVRGRAVEGHEAAIVRNRGIEAGGVSLVPIVVYGDDLGGIRPPVMDEDVRRVVVITRHEVRGRA